MSGVAGSGRYGFVAMWLCGLFVLCGRFRVRGSGSCDVCDIMIFGCAISVICACLVVLG